MRVRGNLRNGEVAMFPRAVWMRARCPYTSDSKQTYRYMSWETLSAPELLVVHTSDYGTHTALILQMMVSAASWCFCLENVAHFCHSPAGGLEALRSYMMTPNRIRRLHSFLSHLRGFCHSNFQVPAIGWSLSFGFGLSISVYQFFFICEGITTTVRITHFQHLTKREIYYFDYSLKTPPNHLKPSAFRSRLEVD